MGKDLTLTELLDGIRLGIGYSLIQLNSFGNDPERWSDLEIARMYVNIRTALMYAEAIKDAWEKRSEEDNNGR